MRLQKFNAHLYSREHNSNGYLEVLHHPQWRGESLESNLLKMIFAYVMHEDLMYPMHAQRGRNFNVRRKVLSPSNPFQVQEIDSRSSSHRSTRPPPGG
ncbi:hypothetical protein KSP40_PGU000393 [Platanthera guangdongensis]|uniref:Uncharacterized protein n=1 Tax=Platanthera guangdongensis TaxID=2320717 RepID=A0ABR2LP89_9ASPA